MSCTRIVLTLLFVLAASVMVLNTAWADTTPVLEYENSSTPTIPKDIVDAVGATTVWHRAGYTFATRCQGQACYVLRLRGRWSRPVEGRCPKDRSLLSVYGFDFCVSDSHKTEHRTYHTWRQGRIRRTRTSQRCGPYEAWVLGQHPIVYLDFACRLK